MNPPPDVFLANFALHAIILSVIAVGLVRCFSNPATRSLAALIGMLAVAILPWFSALAVPGRSTEFSATLPVMTVAPAVAWPISLPDETTEPGLSSAIAPMPTTEPSTFRLAPLGFGLGLWACGCVLGLGLRVRAHFRFRHWQRCLRPPTEAEAGEIQRHLPPELRRCAVRVCGDGESPGVFGLRRVTLIMPTNLLAEGQTRELAWALQHEAAHLRGHDLLWATAIHGIRIVYWWNPLVHHLAGLWSDAREQCCDRQALTAASDARDYGAFLVRLAGRRIPATILSMAASSTFRRIRQRLHSLLSDPVFRPCRRSFVVGGVLVTLCLAAAISQIGLRVAESAKPADAEMATTEVQSSESNPALSLPANPNEIETLQPDGTRIVWTQEPDKRNLRKHTYSPDGSLETLAIYRLDPGGNPLSCDIFDEQRNRLYKGDYGYGKSDGKLVMERFYDQQTRRLDPSSGAEIPVRCYLYKRAANGKRSKPTVEDTTATPFPQSAPRGFPKDPFQNPFAKTDARP
jgi:beta-lactamase regulating signal transducer with metallopeptidase domain